MLSHQNLPIPTTQFRSLSALRKALQKWRESEKKRTLLIIEEELGGDCEELVQAATAEGHHVVIAKDSKSGLSLLRAIAALHTKAQDLVWVSSPEVRMH